MTETGYVAAPGSPSFALHTLGWRAFQDLCAAVLRQVWGQSVQAFADSNDAGRDGAFYGTWNNSDRPNGSEILSGPFVVQCKHTKDVSATLSISVLNDEFSKVEGLVNRGICTTYVLLTNARVTGASEEAIRRKLIASGVEHPLILDGQWLSDMIASHRELRMFVPRVYGLGDLSHILDERAYAQAKVLLNYASDQVSTFVVTKAYRKAAEALRDHRFVLLLGDPAVGKSVIALMLAISAADNWGCLTVKARTSDELVQRWNPHEQEQFFWLDDAFGVVRHEQHLTHGWTRDLPHVMAAVKNGARVVLTSRSYVYNDARPLLKSYAYPLLHEQQVTVDVTELTRLERQQILYNHLAAGDQPKEIRAQMKPHLDATADAAPFLPEAARRLGLQAFTRDLPLTQQSIATFVAMPRQLLSDVYDQLDPEAHAALALTYAAPQSNALTSPVHFDTIQRDIIERAGATAAGTAKALDTHTGTFLRQNTTLDGQTSWEFQHPTLREGFAAWLAGQPHLLPVILTGMDDDTLLRRTDCLTIGSQQAQGTLLRIPPALYPATAERLAEVRRRKRRPLESWQHHEDLQHAVLHYLGRRCSDAFLRAYVVADRHIFDALTYFMPVAAHAPEPPVLARLHQIGLLPEETRQKARTRMADLAVSTPDTSWIEDQKWHKRHWTILLNEAERAQMYEHVRQNLAARLDDAVENWLDDATGEEDDHVETALFWYYRAYSSIDDWETAELFDNARDTYIEARRSLPKPIDKSGSSAGPLHREERPPQDDTTVTQRSIFDDIDR